MGGRISSARKAFRAARSAVSHPLDFLRSTARLPLERDAARRIATLPEIELADLAPSATLTVRVPRASGRTAWSLGAAEQIVIQALIASFGCRTAFEIGTCDGGTTLLLAESLPEDGHVWTLDLPPREFDAMQPTSPIRGNEVGRAYRGSLRAQNITQLAGDSLTYDFSEYHRSSDLVVVDGGHEYENGFSDSRAALAIVRPGGLILWDDFQPFWHGLVNGICDAMKNRKLARLAGTSLAIHVADAPT